MCAWGLAGTNRCSPSHRPGVSAGVPGPSAVEVAQARGAEVCLRSLLVAPWLPLWPGSLAPRAAFCPSDGQAGTGLGRISRGHTWRLLIQNQHPLPPGRGPGAGGPRGRHWGCTSAAGLRARVVWRVRWCVSACVRGFSPPQHTPRGVKAGPPQGKHCSFPGGSLGDSGRGAPEGPRNPAGARAAAGTHVWPGRLWLG